MLEENWRVRLEELSFGSQERRGVTRAGSRASLYRVSFESLGTFLRRKWARATLTDGTLLLMPYACVAYVSGIQILRIVARFSFKPPSIRPYTVHTQSPPPPPFSGLFSRTTRLSLPPSIVNFSSLATFTNSVNKISLRIYTNVNAFCVRVLLMCYCNFTFITVILSFYRIVLFCISLIMHICSLYWFYRHISGFRPLLPMHKLISRYQKGKTSLDLNEARDVGGFRMQWHQLDHMQTIYTSLQTDNHANTSSLNFYRPDALPDAQPTASKHWRPLYCNAANIRLLPTHYLNNATVTRPKYKRGRGRRGMGEGRGCTGGRSRLRRLLKVGAYGTSVVRCQWQLVLQVR